MQFRLMTYNIHKGIGGVDRRYRPERIIATIGRYRPDIVFLQEVDDGVPRSRFDREVDLLGDALGFQHRAFQQNVKLRRGGYGNAILSRFPLSDVHDVDLTIPLKKCRKALVAHCGLRWEHHSRTLLLMNVHLGLAGFERAMQLRKLLSCDALQHTQRSTATIVGGDFNDVWGNLGKHSLEPQGFMPALGTIKTFPAILPMRPLDRVYFRGGLTLENSFASHTKLSQHASDHLPAILDFVLT
ncbi:MAG: endonuclease/exonuclease/phosphatase family protein [Planctomycetaceae bacterium]|nr:endonuclease/exonuclease/phosphatase family protein [Planctomycetales bacterium]MCB9873423.1 endonuclease/exonuclease/phosphatase family protein [Planctomycetaceae bacterium]MCB9939070.1 endonuclease/exonuclease/phosphatase family protein [Planctomycetaceae bacterium]HRX79686.1 endonuclease/exonuclease/phosphatase family protein [Pirellulaceae bacterium]